MKRVRRRKRVRRIRRVEKWPEDRFGRPVPFAKRSLEERLEIIKKAREALQRELGLTKEQAKLAVRRWRKSEVDRADNK